MWTLKLKSNGEKESSSPPPNYGYIPNVHNNKPRLDINKDNYGEYLKHIFVQAGDYVCFKTSKADTPTCVHVVVDVVTEYDNLPMPKVEYHSGHPRCLHISNGWQASQPKWERWDSPEYYRKLTEEEVVSLVGKDHDHIQNYIQRLRQTT